MDQPRSFVCLLGGYTRPFLCRFLDVQDERGECFLVDWAELLLDISDSVQHVGTAIDVAFGTSR
jgi:hypothetical protein